MFTSKALNFYVTWIKLSDSFIVELNPKVITFLYVAEVMAKVSSSVMHHNSLQCVGELVIHFCDSFFLGDRVVVYVQFMGEFPPRVNFFVFKFVIVKAHTLEVDNKVVGCFVEEVSLNHIAFVVARITLIVGNLLTCDEFSERLFNVFITLYLKGKGIECFFSFFYSIAS